MRGCLRNTSTVHIAPHGEKGFQLFMLVCFPIMGEGKRQFWARGEGIEKGGIKYFYLNLPILSSLLPSLPPIQIPPYNQPHNHKNTNHNPDNYIYSHSLAFCLI